MTVFLESPMPILFFGIIAEAVLVACVFHTRRGVLLWPMAAVVLILLGGLALEQYVVTEREQVEATIDGAAAALSDNDLPRVLRYLSNEAEHTRSRAEWAMARVDFTSVTIHGLEITVNSLTSPPTAEARFNGVAYYRDRRGEFPYEHYAARFIVQLQWENDQWRITDHVEHSPRGLWGSDP